MADQEVEVRIPDSPTTENPNTIGGVSGKVEDAARYLPKALNALEERSGISFSVIGLIGYVVIAAFGKMDTLGKYLAYIFFLLSTVLIYQLVHSKQKPIVWFLLLLILFLTFGISLQNGWLKFLERYL